MIKYSLGCEKEHEFEGWFSSSDEFARLQEDGLLDCPVCGSNKIQKLLMAPSVKSTKGKDVIVRDSDMAASIAAPVPSQAPSVPVATAPAIPSTPSMPDVPAEVREQVVQQLREIKQHVLDNAENVGENFGEEARKIHYGEGKKRGIYGQTSADEAAELIEEGIDVMPLPVLPEDAN